MMPALPGVAACPAEILLQRCITTASIATGL